jgi:hypothetical protein
MSSRTSTRSPLTFVIVQREFGLVRALLLRSTVSFGIGRVSPSTRHDVRLVRFICDGARTRPVRQVTRRSRAARLDTNIDRRVSRHGVVVARRATRICHFAVVVVLHRDRRVTRDVELSLTHFD